MNKCHPGKCQGGERCNKRVKLWCKCKRIKKDYPCSPLQKCFVKITLECDSVCESLKNERKKAEEAIIAKKLEEEKLRNLEEIEKFEKKFKPRRKRKNKYENSDPSQENAKNKCRSAWILAIIVSIIGITIVYMTAPDLSIPGISWDSTI